MRQELYSTNHSVHKEGRTGLLFCFSFNKLNFLYRVRERETLLAFQISVQARGLQQESSSEKVFQGIGYGIVLAPRGLDWSTFQCFAPSIIAIVIQTAACSERNRNILPKWRRADFEEMPSATASSQVCTRSGNGLVLSNVFFYKEHEGHSGSSESTKSSHKTRPAFLCRSVRCNRHRKSWYL